MPRDWTNHAAPDAYVDADAPLTILRLECLVFLVELLKSVQTGAVRLMRGEHSDFSGLRGASGQRQSVLTEAISHTLCSKSCSTEYNEVS